MCIEFILWPLDGAMNRSGKTTKILLKMSFLKRKKNWIKEQLDKTLTHVSQEREEENVDLELETVHNEDNAATVA